MRMDEKEVVRRLGPPDEILTRKDRMRRQGWMCADCYDVVRSEVPRTGAMHEVRWHNLPGCSKRPVVGLKAKPVCKRCDGTEWVGGFHPDRPWDMHNPRGCECGAGAPCPDCNPLHRDADKLDSDAAIRRITRMLGR